MKLGFRFAINGPHAARTMMLEVIQLSGTQVTHEETQAFLDRRHPQRFTPASLMSFAQDVAGTWTAAGLLTGHRRELRSLPARRPESLALLLFLAYFSDAPANVCSRPTGGV